jgi:hypothetical protein
VTKWLPLLRKSFNRWLKFVCSTLNKILNSLSEKSKSWMKKSDISEESWFKSLLMCSFVVSACEEFASSFLSKE